MTVTVALVVATVVLLPVAFVVYRQWMMICAARRKHAEWLKRNFGDGGVL